MSIDVKDPTLGDIFEKFRNRCVELQICYSMYRHLFEADEDVSDILRRTAMVFFHDLNRILIEQIYLHISRITDPARSGKRENLSVANINEMLERAGLMTGNVDHLSKQLMRYRDIIKEVRNKIIAHLDKQTVVNNLKIGVHAAEEVTAFFENLYEYCDEVGLATGKGPLDFRTVAGPGDVLDLINALGRSLENSTAMAKRSCPVRNL
jgi:hypothetical protein